MRLKGKGRAVLSVGAIFFLTLDLSASAATPPTPREKPVRVSANAAAPASAAAATDRDRLIQQLDAVRREDFSRASAIAGSISDPLSKSLAQWLFFAADNPLATPAAADAFITAHAQWPALGRIQANAEKRMTDEMPAKAVLAFFQNRDPVTPEGRLQLARALYATGAKDAADLQIREAWRIGTFTLADEQKILSVYGSALTGQDHVTRVDRLLWAREPVSARRVFSRLSESERRKAEARAELLSGSPNGPLLFDALPAAERADPGVLHAAIRFYRRHESEPRAVELARLLPADPAKLRNAARLWEERQLLMRWALTEKRYADAYSLAANAGLESGSEFAEAEFSAGWIALRFLNAPERAEVHFTALAGGVTAPISKSRAFYWLGRAAAAKGDDALAERRYKQAAAFPFTYYGQLAAERLGPAAFADAVFPPPQTATAEDKARFAARPAAKALTLLGGLPDADNYFLTFAFYLDDLLESPGEYLELARVAERSGAMHAVVRAGKVAVGRGHFVPEAAYPVIEVPAAAARFAPKEVILGLSRQESEFNPRAFSSAGARGLMQLLPATAQITARKEGLRYDKSALLNDPQQNLVLGAAHLSHLFQRFSGSYIMTFAAYNAGPNRVDEWVGRYGDPRAPGVDPIDWVEQIPFQETRNYVQRVLENTQVYRARLNKHPIPGRLAVDLERGGPQSRAGRLAAIRADQLPPAPQRTFQLASLAAIDAPSDAPRVRLKPPADAAAQPLPGAAPPPAAVAQETAPASSAPKSDVNDGAVRPAETGSAPAKPVADKAAVKTSATPSPLRQRRLAPAPDPADAVASDLNARNLEAARASAAADPVPGAVAPDASLPAAPAEVGDDGGASDDESGPHPAEGDQG